MCLTLGVTQDAGQKAGKKAAAKKVDPKDSKPAKATQQAPVAPAVAIPDHSVFNPPAADKSESEFPPNRALLWL